MKKNFKKKILKNGMTILFEKRDIPIISCTIAVKAGGVHETLEEKGISHFIEHMLFKGTPTRNWKQVTEAFEKNGGEVNAFTSSETTAYYCKMPSDKIEIALDVLSDIVKNPLFDKKELEKERKVIFEEIKLYHDNPLLHIFDESQKTLYGGTLSINLIGTHETMGKVDQKKIKEKFKEIYTPNNMILCVVGDADFDELVKFVEKTFGNEKKEISVKEISLINKEVIEKRKGIDQANLVFAYHVPLAEDNKKHVAKILSTMTAEGLSSRLLAEIREKRNLAYSIKGDANINKNFAYNLIYVGTSKENVKQVKELILKEFQKIAKDLDEKELGEIKTQLIGRHKLSMEDSETQMMNLLASEIQTKAEDFYEFEKEVKQIKLKDVKEMASQVKEGNYSFFALVPED